IRNEPSFTFDPTSRDWQVVNGFVQATMPLTEHTNEMLGTKLTYHDFTGFEWQPSARLWWTPSEHQTFWASVSRPVRVPSRLEEESTPANLAQLHSYWNIGDDIELNAALYHTSRIPRLAIDAYTRFDLGLGWRITDRWRVDVWGQNLQDEGHQEASAVEIPRS